MFRRLLIVVTILWMSFFALLVQASPRNDTDWVLLGLMLIPPAAVWWVFYGNEL